MLHGLEGEAPSVGAELLADIKEVFDSKQASKVFSAELLDALLQDEEAPWATWNRGKPMSPRQLSAKLSDFGIKSGTVRMGANTKKGYSRDQFSDAFARYLTSAESVTSSQPSNGAASSDYQSVTSARSVTDKKSLKPKAGAGCNDVTDRDPAQRKEPVEQYPVTDDEEGL